MKPSKGRRTLFGSLAPLVLTLMACGERIESSYATLADAKRDGAIERGWLPNILPEGSCKIREVHSIDVARTWSTFEFPAEDATGLRAALDGSKSTGQLTGVPSPGVPWWPDVLQGTLDLAVIEMRGFSLYKEGQTLFAIDWKSRRAFVYRDSQ